jgi:ABC-type cobalamin/Fe3+-siderophores transport system ATPase subunit
MRPLIQNLTVERYRSLRRIEIGGLGRVNLITGRNDSGKSSLLEAVRVLAANASPYVLYDIIRLHEDANWDNEYALRVVADSGALAFSNLFYGFPLFAADLEPIHIVADGEERSMTLRIGTAWISERRDAVSEPSRLRDVAPADLSSAVEGVPGLVIEANGVRCVRTLDALHRNTLNRLPQPALLPERAIACSFVDAGKGLETTILSQRWDEIVLSGLETEVVKALQGIDPQIEAIAMIGSGMGGRGRTAMVRHASRSRPLPLRSFGDGINRLFGILVSLVAAKDGLLLIDQVDNALHHTIQYDVWKLISTLAQRLNVQVLATTQNWEIIEAFQKASSETPEDGVLVRLLRKRDHTIATVLSKEDLRIVTRDKIEVR